LEKTLGGSLRFAPILHGADQSSRPAGKEISRVLQIDSRT
jgi:hypothetical protein